MKIGIAQMSSRAGDFEQTARRMVEQSRRAAEQGVDLLVFPLATLVGATPVTSSDREGFLLDTASCVMGLVDDLACPALIPIIGESGGSAVPEVLLVADGDVTPVCLSARIQAESSASGANEASDALPELAFRGARLGVAFTYEELDVYNAYDYDVDVIIFLSTYSFATDDPSSALGTALSESRFPADAETTGAWIVGVGSVGCYDSQVFCGSSFVLAPWGELAAQAPTLEEALLVCDVDPSAEGPLADPLSKEVFDLQLTTWTALSAGLSDIVGELGSRGACVRVDGRLASMLALTLAVDALGPTNVRALVCADDPARDKASLDIARALRLPASNVDHLELSAPLDGLSRDDLAEARLAQTARRTGCVPLGSLDKTGLALEEAPLISAARVLPFGDLYRSDLIALARMRNTVSPVIPQPAIAAACAPKLGGVLSDLPSEEARIEFVDIVLSGYVEWELPVSDIVAERGRADAVGAIIRRLRHLEPLRPARPRVIAVSSRTLDEARGPLGLVWHDRVRDEGERLMTKLAEFASSVREGAREEEPEERPEPRPAGAAEEAAYDREVRDLLGYLRDLSAGGGFSSFDLSSGQGESDLRHGGGPIPPGIWDEPFSEN